MTFGIEATTNRLPNRAERVAAFNGYFADYHAYAQRSGYWRGFRKVKAGVELALGREIDDFNAAIPEDYTGDGSYEVKFRDDEGPKPVEVVRREYIGVFYLDDRLREDRKVAPYTAILKAVCVPFRAVHPDHYLARVKYEAFLDSAQGRSEGEPNLERYHKSDFQFAELDLRSTRMELMLADDRVAEAPARPVPLSTVADRLLLPDSD